MLMITFLIILWSTVMLLLIGKSYTMNHPEKAGFEYINTAAIEFVLTNTPKKALLIAQYLTDLVNSQIEKRELPHAPGQVNGLDKFLKNAKSYGFVLGNHQAVAKQIEVLLDFERQRKLRNSHKRK